MSGRTSNTFKVVHLQTKASAQVVIRNRAGKKLFDIDVAGVSITVAISPDAEIKIEPMKPKNPTTQQLAKHALQTVKQMSPQEKAELRKRLDQQLNKTERQSKAKR